MEERIQKITAQQIARSQNELRSQLDHRAQRLHDMVDSKLKRNQMSMDSLKNDMQHSLNVSQSFGGKFPLQVTEPKDRKTQALQSNLLDDVKVALAAERLDCKPIRGVDLPLLNSGGMGTGELVEVSNLDRIETVNVRPPPLRLDDDSKSLAMLLPS